MGFIENNRYMGVSENRGITNLFSAIVIGMIMMMMMMVMMMMMMVVLVMMMMMMINQWMDAMDEMG